MQRLADIAAAEAAKFYHGNCMGALSNLKPIVDLFPYSATWTLDSWDNCWCAAFVYHCVRLAGYELSVRFPDDRVTCNFAGVIAWKQWAQLPAVGKWLHSDDVLEKGDIVLFNQVFNGHSPDHIGILINCGADFVETAEGNFGNVSAIISRAWDRVDGFIRL